LRLHRVKKIFLHRHKHIHRRIKRFKKPTYVLPVHKQTTTTQTTGKAQVIAEKKNSSTKMLISYAILFIVSMIIIF